MEAKREQLRAKLRQTLGSYGDGAGDQPLLDPVVLESTDLGDVIRERVEYSTVDGLRVPAYVLLPKERGKLPLPAVLAWHGHGYGSRQVVGLLPDGSEDQGEPGIHRHFALELCRRGLVVIAPEIVGFGDRKLDWDIAQNPDTPNSCFPIAAALLMAGKTIAGLRAHEAIRAADYLAQRAEVDASRIGCMGLSGGGMVASLSAALDKRILATVICGYSNTYESSILARRHCLDNYIPGILLHAEMPELIGLIAPRALFIESGSHDPLFPVEATRTTIAKLEEIYTSLGAEGNIESDIFEGGHEISGRLAFDWLARKLADPNKN
ncbi:dienelactone hydrolase family protein [Paenibacillus agricola]|uniref:dienelactone hydrolase family protein n=1 Tax=Paenibacillus agricola TaxID=2716264 RepID=UPI001FB7AFE5|nr:alpha/beta hydrolase family protein [Paenibacillus agricola]